VARAWAGPSPPTSVAGHAAEIPVELSRPVGTGAPRPLGDFHRRGCFCSRILAAAAAGRNYFPHPPPPFRPSAGLGRPALLPTFGPQRAESVRLPAAARTAHVPPPAGDCRAAGKSGEIGYVLNSWLAVAVRNSERPHFT
jgi:hypothetical protein